MTRLMSNQTSSLVGRIYDCALDPGHWSATLADVAQVMGCARAILSLNDLARNRILIHRSVGWDQHWLDERNRHAAEINTKIGSWLARRRFDEPFVASREISLSEFQSSAYAQKCLSPLSIGDVMHFALVSTPSYFSEIVFFKALCDGPATDDDIGNGLLLLPHLRRAIEITNALDLQVAQRDRLVETLDALRSAVIVTNSAAAILHHNRTAASMLETKALIEKVNGTVRAKLRTANEQLYVALQYATNVNTSIGRVGASVRLTSTFAAPVFAYVLPIAGNDRAKHNSEASAAIFIDGNSEKAGSPDAFASSYQLTGAEARLVGCLLTGKTLSCASRDLGVAMTTIKTHLRSVFSKTGVGRQADLIRLAVRSEPPVFLE